MQLKDNIHAKINDEEQYRKIAHSFPMKNSWKKKYVLITGVHSL
jgi:hypothetical protein